MPVRQVWESVTSDGRQPVPFESWLATLPAQDQHLYHQAKLRQHEHRSLAIENGDMIIDSAGGYIWRDEHAALKGKPQDAIWAEFHARYHRECGVQTLCREEKI